MRTLLRMMVAGCLALASAGGARAQAASADSAYRAGDVARAERLYGQILAADSSDAIALHRMALLLAWREQHAASLRLFDRLIGLLPDNLDARVDRARVLAWRGQTRAAVAAIDSALVLDPRHAGALQARAQFLAWAGEYRASVRAYDRVLELAPDLPGVRTDRARVLIWSEDIAAAIAVYDSLLRVDPRDTDAQLGLAHALAAGSRPDSALVLYRAVLAREPGNVPAAQGVARTLSWRGRLAAGEAAWREALALSPDEPGSIAGLAQNLRWQGRDAAAWESLRGVPVSARSMGDVREQRAALRPALSPRALPSVLLEDDSDDNRMLTFAVNGAFRPTLRSELRADAYVRNAEDPSSGMQAWGGALVYWRQLEPGWNLSAGAGVSASDAPGSKPFTVLRAAATSPARNPLTAGMTLARSAFDATAALIRREVASDELNADLRWSGGSWNAGGGAGIARLESRISGAANERWSVTGVIGRRTELPLLLGARARAYGYSEDANDGYFDPELYAVGELTARYLREASRWTLDLEGAPGVQRIVRHGESGASSASWRANARLARTVGAGRQLSATFAFANSGLQQLSPGSAGDYRYLALGLAATWIF